MRGSATGEGMGGLSSPVHANVASRYAAPAPPAAKPDSPEYLAVRYSEESGTSFTRMNDNVATLLF
jgi:hypothetical protein